MSILNRPSNGLPSVLLTLWRTVRFEGPLAKKQLFALCAPLSLSHHSSRFDNRNMVKATLKRWTELHLFDDDGGKVGLCPPFHEIDPEADPEYGEFRAAALELVLDKGANRDLVRKEPRKAADFSFAACWVLGQDVFALPGGAYEGASGIQPIELPQIPEEPFAFRTKTRWEGFKDWASFLGLGWNTRIAGTTVFNADPAEAIRRRLPGVFGESSELPQERFFDQLSRVLPILDRGELRHRAEKRFQPPWRPLEDHELSPALTRALTRLEIEGVLKLEMRADAENRSMLARGFAPLRQVSHLVWRKLHA